ncbi:MAG: hypothetical protein EZS28_048850 [Streblomastix strix]|uniref:Uncharacterized protein n=1 Tax=Streblomastix strix TaxID=222440 RepID=A0A5J4TCW2_9EUKA|nr:MAG: hypothetical protein EZS28_048850 [Streblomastix strix]
MNLNPTIDLLSQHFNNLLPRFISTTMRHKEIAINSLNQERKMELPWIHPPIDLFPAVLKKFKKEQIKLIIIALIWPGQIQFTELINKNRQPLILSQNNYVLEPRISLAKKCMKFPPSKIVCFLID